MKRRQWHELRPDLVDQIRHDLAANYPTLHLSLEGRWAEVRGTFPVLGEGGKVLDRFQIRIVLPPGFPRSLPITWETGGRIPWTSARHVVEHSGAACVLLPDERWRVFPVGAPLLDYLKGPLHSYFLGQLVVAAGGKWPYGEWGHAADGILEFYYDTLGVRTPEAVLRYLAALKRPKLKPHKACPCGSSRHIGECCIVELKTLRDKIDPETAAESQIYVRKEIERRNSRQIWMDRPRKAETLISVAGLAVGLP